MALIWPVLSVSVAMDVGIAEQQLGPLREGHIVVEQPAETPVEHRHGGIAQTSAHTGAHTNDPGLQGRLRLRLALGLNHCRDRSATQVPRQHSCSPESGQQPSGVNIHGICSMLRRP